MRGRSVKAQRTVRRVRMRTALAAALAAAVLSGCATAVTGTAAPVVGAPTQQSGPTSAPETTGSTDPSTGSGPTTAESTPSTPTDSTGSTEPTDETRPTDETGSTDGTGSTAETGAPSDPSLYPTTPIALNKTPSTEESAALLEARRLSAYSVAPPEVNPDYSETSGLSTLPFKGPEAISSILPAPVPTVAKRGGMYTGFTSTRSTKDGSGALVIATFVYPSAAAAAKAAGDLAAAIKGDDDAKLSVPGQSKAVGWSGPASDGAYAHAFLATGAVVAYAWVRDTAAKKATLPAVVGKALTAEVTSLKDYKPTPKADMMALPVDPDGLFSRTLPMPSGESTVRNGSWPAKGALHTQIIYPASAKVFADAGVDVVSIGRSAVYRAKDDAGATAIRDAFFAETVTLNPKMREFTPGTDAGSARCLQDTLRAFYQCVAAAGRYAFEYGGSTEDDITKSLDAQVALLQD